MKPFLVAVAASLLLATPALAGEDNDGRVKMKPRSCVPRHNHIAKRRKGVIFSYSRGHEPIWYACASWVGHSYNLYGPLYKEFFAETDRGCDLGSYVTPGPVRGETARYRLYCGYSFGTEGSGVIRWRCRINLRSGVIRYRELPKRRRR